MLGIRLLTLLTLYPLVLRSGATEGNEEGNFACLYDTSVCNTEAQYPGIRGIGFCLTEKYATSQLTDECQAEIEAEIDTSVRQCRQSSATLQTNLVCPAPTSGRGIPQHMF